MLFHFSCRSIKSIMKLCDTCDKFWTMNFEWVLCKSEKPVTCVTINVTCATLTENPWYWKQLIADFKHLCLWWGADLSKIVCTSYVNVQSYEMFWICSGQRNMWHYTWIPMPQQEVKATKIVIPILIQQTITTVLLDCTRRVEINI